MVRKTKDDQPMLTAAQGQPQSAALQRRRALILPALLREEANKQVYAGIEQDQAYAIFQKWADFELKGRLDRKETAVDATFLDQVFGDALGYRLLTANPDSYDLERNYTVPEVGTSDGCIGRFRHGETPIPVAVIELKGAGVNLDTDRSQGRTPVQQLWDYMNALPECPWGIVSNFVSFRLYHRSKSSQTFEHFTLQELRNRQRFKDFYCLFQRGGLLEDLHRPPRAEKLLKDSGERQREVGDKLYADYNNHRLRLIDHLHARLGKSLDAAIAIAQRLIDRIVFVAFCEDRGLINGESIKRTFETIPPYTKVRNPRWQNFLGMFEAMDGGHADFGFDKGGFNGGLFRHDPEVDDLQLTDDWTDFFNEVATYDFRDEINVDVLGHLFERSITDLENLRLAGGLLPPEEPDPPEPGKMKKSAQRKRHGVYYTPPAFTDLIVHHTVGALIEERLTGLAEKHGIDPKEVNGKDARKHEVYWREALAALREIKVCDPACGSGAFLIRAYEVFEDQYTEIADHLDDGNGAVAPDLVNQIPDIILNDNLFGVDLSPEAVEIAQLALWIRSAKRGRTLSDLSRNIVCGNSLVTDPAVDPRAMTWETTFPDVFQREKRGFDCVIGNPPWERLKLQEREFFSASAPKIAESVSAAQRRKLITKLAKSDPELYARYQDAKLRAEQVLDHVRNAGGYPLTGQGDINYYMLFAELGRRLIAPTGRVGLLLPSGIATDDTTKEFFCALMDDQSLLVLYDFENKKGFFPDVHRAFKFSTLVFGGSMVKAKQADFVFFAHALEDLDEKKRHIKLTPKDLELLNPNTRTCPVFRGRRDYELTKAIYNRVPILVEESRGERGNPWGVRFIRMFDQTNDAELFHEAGELKKNGFKFQGNRWVKKKEAYLPLYEAKMIQAYDHRAAGVSVDQDNWMRQGQTVKSSLVSHQKAEFVPQPRWWVAESEVDRVLGGRVQAAYLAYKDVTSPTNQRTMIAAFVPHVAMVNSAPIALIDEGLSFRITACLLANLNSFALDYVARQKVGGVHLNFFIVEQLPMFSTDRYVDRCPWKKSQTLEKWISDRVLKLTCTSDDMVPLAEACGMTPPVHKWKSEERAELLAELDAAYFHLYGLSREESEYVLSTFAGADSPKDTGLVTQTPAAMVLSKYDELAGGAA